jgi:hypothetical protein
VRTWGKLTAWEGVRWKVEILKPLPAPRPDTNKASTSAPSDRWPWHGNNKRPWSRGAPPSRKKEQKLRKWFVVAWARAQFMLKNNLIFHLLRLSDRRIMGYQISYILWTWLLLIKGTPPLVYFLTTSYHVAEHPNLPILNICRLSVDSIILDITLEYYLLFEPSKIQYYKLLSKSISFSYFLHLHCIYLFRAHVWYNQINLPNSQYCCWCSSTP